MGYASDRRDRKRGKRRENLGAILGLFGGIARGLQTEAHHRDLVATKQAQLLLDEKANEAKLGIEREKLDVSRSRAQTYDETSRTRADAALITAKKGGAGGTKATAAQMERAVNAIRASGARRPGDFLKYADAADAKPMEAEGGFLERLLGTGAAAEAKKNRSAARYVLQTQPDALESMFDPPRSLPEQLRASGRLSQKGQQQPSFQQQLEAAGFHIQNSGGVYSTSPQGGVIGQNPQMQGPMDQPPQFNAAPGGMPQDEEGQQLQSLSEAYMTAINGRPGDPAAMQAWAQIGQVFPQLVPAWVKAQAMGGFSVPPASAAQPDQKAQQLEQAGRAMWKLPQ